MTVKCIDWTSSSREIALSTVMGSLVLMFEILLYLMQLQCYRQVKLDQVQVGWKIGWIQDQIGCCHFVAEI